MPAWFLLRNDETILICSQSAKIKLRNISRNPVVAPGLDVTGLGPDIIRIDGTAEHAPGFPAADQAPEYVVKYAERIGALFGTPSQFAALYSEPLIATSRRL